MNTVILFTLLRINPSFTRNS